MIDATRDLHGLRPKDATLLAARAIADGLDAAVHAVSDALHVHRALPDDPKRSSYEVYWAERGAIPGRPFGWVLPRLDLAPPRPKKRDEVKTAIVAAARAPVAAEADTVLILAHPENRSSKARGRLKAAPRLDSVTN